MSISTVKAGLDDIATAIRTERQACVNSKARITTARDNLVGLITTHSDTITEIGTYNADTGSEFEKLSKDELDKLATEFTALRAELDSVVLSLDSTVEI